MITLTDKNKCCGCTACEQVCPVGAISMQEDKEGFLAPIIDADTCISCKKCTNVCPAEKSLTSVESIAVFAAKSKDDTLVSNSSSGGMFGTIAKRILKQGGIVFGAGFDGDFNVVHKSAENPAQLQQLMGSKYVQSDLGNTYQNVRDALTQGRQVLFVGTPCQCVGLSHFLGKSYNNLVMLDFVCHGVPSSKLFRNYLDKVSGDKEISKVNFRCKTKGQNGYEMGVDFADGTQYRSKFAKDPYMLAYVQDISLRKSCYACFAKNMHAASDITMGDFWGLNETDSILADEESVSLVVVNTDKGRDIFETVSGELEVDCRNMAEACKCNPCLVSSVKKNPLRERYLKDSTRLDIKELADKYCGSSYAAKFRRFVAGRIKGK